MFTIRRENGLEILYQAFERCISVLSMSTKPEEVGAQVCKHMARFYSVAAQFEMCRTKIVEITGLCKNVCRIFYYKVDLVLQYWCFFFLSTPFQDGMVLS